MKLRNHGKRERSIATTLGELCYVRTMLIPADTRSKRRLQDLEERKSIYPLDTALGVESSPLRMSPALIIEAANWAINFGSYEKAERFLNKRLDLNLNDDSIRKATNLVGRLVFDEDCKLAAIHRNAFEAREFEDWQQEEEARNYLAELANRAPRKGFLVLEVDGSAVNTRFLDENGSSWRENKLGMVYSSDHIRTWHNAKGEKQTQILEREYISLLGPVDEFRWHLCALAARNGYGLYGDTILLSDGAKWIRRMKDLLFPDAQQILDLFHLFENTHSYAKAVFPNDGAHANKWAEELCERLEAGRYQDVLKELQEYEHVILSGNTVNLPNYIRDNESNIDYPTYKKRGWPVGSGAVESGNKLVVQSRLKLPGMRWLSECAQNLVTLKSKEESGLWNKKVADVVTAKLMPFAARGPPAGWFASVSSSDECSSVSVHEICSDCEVSIQTQAVESMLSKIYGGCI